MLSNIFLKTLYEKRWAMLWWGIAMFATTLLIVVLFPTFQNAFGKTLNDVPDSLKQVLGNASDYQRIEGFLQLQVFMQMIFLTVIYGIILCTGLIAGEEGQGTLQTLLAQPVSRTKVYFQKLLAASAVLWVVNFALFIAIWVGCLLIGEAPNYWRVFLATNVLWLVSMVFSLTGFALGAATGKRGLSGAFAGIYAFLAYLINSLIMTVDWLKYPNYLSPIKYFSEPRIMDYGLDVGNVVILSGACIILTIIGWLVFKKRDIYSR